MKFAIFLSGISMATFTGAGFFFVKFWRASRDSFFLYFCIACWLLAIERVCGVFISDTMVPVRTSLEGPGTWIYILRLVAFALILAAVIKKNRELKGRN